MKEELKKLLDLIPSEQLPTLSDDGNSMLLCNGNYVYTISVAGDNLFEFTLDSGHDNFPIRWLAGITEATHSIANWVWYPFNFECVMKILSRKYMEVLS